MRQHQDWPVEAIYNEASEWLREIPSFKAIERDAWAFRTGFLEAVKGETEWIKLGEHLNEPVSSEDIGLKRVPVRRVPVACGAISSTKV
jgi:hypothetical protein